MSEYYDDEYIDDICDDVLENDGDVNWYSEGYSDGKNNATVMISIL